MTTRVPYQLLTPEAQTAFTAFRNKLINGDFRVVQRGTSGTIAASVVGFTADRWLISNTTDQTLSWTVASSQSYGRNRDENYLSLSFAAAPTTGTVLVQQRIEDVRNLAGGQATLAFDTLDVQGVVSTQASTSFEQIFGSGGSTAVYTTPVSETIATGRMSSTHTIPSVAGKTIGAGSHLSAFMSFDPRNIGYWVIGQVQVESGPVATPFESRPLALEMALCQRYHEAVYYQSFYVPGTTATLMYVPVPFKVRKRVPPVVTLPSSANAAYDATGAVLTPTTWTSDSPNVDACRIEVGHASGVGGVAVGVLTAEAEL
jgi:hypothetical protein